MKNCLLIVALMPLLIIISLKPDTLIYLNKVCEYLEYVFDLAGLVVRNPFFLFITLFVVRYLRVFVHLFSFWVLYTPTPVPRNPTILPKDVSVILPTIDPQNVDFRECFMSCLTNHPGEIIIVTVGRNMAALTNQVVAPYIAAFPNTHIQVHSTQVANKRVQVAHGVNLAKGKVTVLLDDHVFWPSPHFLATLLAPFENDKVGAVGTNKRVRRTETGFNIRSFWNMIGALYLERHNFEIRATNAIDGGVFVVSGRTAAYRTSILQSPNFLHDFTHEMFFGNSFGPLNADDDNFLTRQVVARGYDIKIQYSKDAMIETTLGTYPKFLSQCLRWVRTTWRSNSASLFTDRTVWRRQPWCVYAVYLTSFVNFALFNDAALIYTLSQVADQNAVKALIAWIFFTKMIKLTPYFLREPQDLLMLPGYFVFAYFHSFIKLYAGLTFWVTAWGGRNLDPINQGQGGHDDDGDDSDGHDADDDIGRLSSGSLTEVPASSSSSPTSGGTARRRPPIASQQAGVRFQTPWGRTRSTSPFNTPANVLESQMVSPHTNRRTSPPRAPPSTPSPNSPWRPALQTPFSPAPIPNPNLNLNLNLPPTPSPTPTPIRPTTLPTPAPITANTFILPRERHGLGIPDRYQRTWTRGKQCQCLHSDADLLYKTRSCRCDVPSLFATGRGAVHGNGNVRPRSRFFVDEIYGEKGK